MTDQRRAVRENPTNAIAHGDLGFVLFFSGRYADALAAFEKALSLAPSYRHLQPWRLECLLGLGRDGAGDPGVTLALDNNGGQADWVVRLLQFQLGRLTGEELLGKVSSEDEAAANAQRCEAHYFIGRARERVGSASRAAPKLRTAAALSPANRSARPFW